MKRKWHIIVPVLSVLASLALGATITQSISLTSFNAGELSPLMHSRVDFAKYRAGAQTLQNMIVRSQGPVTRRPGTKYIATVKDSGDKVRLIPFEYSTSDAYILELGDEYMRFYRNGAQVLSAGNPYELVTPWDSNDLFEIQFAQDAQTMRFVLPGVQPYKLTRNSASHTDWTLSAISFKHGPFIDENTDKTSNITPSGITGTITLDCNDNIWDANHVGALWEITHLVDSNSISGRFWMPWYDVTWGGNVIYDFSYHSGSDWSAGADGNSTSIKIYHHQGYTLTTANDWWGELKLQRSYDNQATWNTVKSFSYRGNGNVLYSGIEDQNDAFYRVRMEGQIVSAHMHRNYEGTCDWTLSRDAFLRHGVVKIASFVDANEVTATVQVELASTEPTWRWAEGAWSTYRGWPRTIEHHEQRCLYGGTASWPQTIWASITASEDKDYDDFDSGLGDAADAWFYVLPGMNPIQWLKSGEYLMVGTTEGIGKLGMPDKPIDPTWPPVYRTQAKDGAAYLQAVRAVDAILYVERGNRKVRELTYTYASDRYIAPDMTILAEHITDSGIKQIDFQERPDPILWCVRNDGVLLSFTYQRHHEVESWARHTTGTNGTDDFESVARIPGSNEDELWAVVKRTINGSSVRYVEEFQPLDWGSNNSNAWFVDCGGTNQAAMSQLEGASVKLFGDGRPVEGTTYTVSGGNLSPAAVGYSVTNIGLPYTSILETMPLVVALEGEDSLGRYTAVKKLTVDFYKTLGCHLGANATYAADLKFSSDNFATTMTPFTGTKGDIPYPRGISRGPSIYITESSPVPLTIRHIVADVEVTVE